MQPTDGSQQSMVRGRMQPTEGSHTEIAMMEKEIGYLLKERHYYYFKCLEIESLCKQRMLGDGDSTLAREVMKVLTEMEDDFEVPPDGSVHNMEG